MQEMLIPVDMKISLDRTPMIEKISTEDINKVKWPDVVRKINELVDAYNQLEEHYHPVIQKNFLMPVTHTERPSFLFEKED